MSERVKRFFEQRRLAAEGTWTPSEVLSKPQEDQAFAKSLYFAESIGFPARADRLSSSRPPQRIERFFQRRRDAEEGTWSPLPSMTLSTQVRAPQLLAPVPRHGAPLVVQDEPDIVWNRPNKVHQIRSFSDCTPREQEGICLAVRLVAVLLMVVGLILLACGQEYGPPLIWGGMLTFACSFVRERHSNPMPAPKKPPQAAPFQLAWATTYSPEELYWREELGSAEEPRSFEFGSSRYEPA